VGLSNMKRFHFLLVCLFAAALANAHVIAVDSDAQTQQAVGSSAINLANVPTGDSPGQTAPLPSKLRHRQAARASFSNIKGGVVKEIKATSAFVQQQAATADGWLIALVAFGLVVLQLRRKHKSLPQRRIAPYV
jgi:hypothetical protein